MKMNPRVISEETIKPSNPTPSHLRYLKASLLDHANTPVLMPVILFYSKRCTPTTSTFLSQLKHSLPTTLSVFYPLAGRVQDVNYFVCNDEGVPYVQTEVSSTCLSEVAHKAEVSLLDTLLPPYGNNEGYTKILLAIQVNTFACGGVAIGIKMSHVISDGLSLIMFAKTWASIASGDNQESISQPYFEIWKIFPPHESGISTTNEESNLDLIETRPVTKWFMFSKAKCDALRSRLEYNYKNRPSSTMVLSAFIWSRIKLACRSEGENNVPHEVYQAVNIRPKVNTLSESCYYFGNMVVNAIVELSQHGHRSLSDSYITGMEKSIEKIIGNGGNKLIEDMKNGKEDLRFLMEHFERESRGEIMSLGFSSLRSSLAYEPDFGWGKPVWVTSATLVYKDLIILIPAGPSSHDIYAFVNLSPDQMIKLERDQEFISFVSKSATFVTSKL